MANKQFEISIIGLGLIGGSFAYALRDFKDCNIVGYDVDLVTMNKALETGAIDKSANSLEESVCKADITIFCSNPSTIMNNIKICASHFKEGSIITDICGVKQEILSFVSEYLSKDIDYIGIHPMAGSEFSGFENADNKLFQNAGFIITLPKRYNESSFNLINELCIYLGARQICINTAYEHDNIIAYTSDLMHISAAALCIDFPKSMTMAHTAGAFRDCTRIANLDPVLWTELLTKNAESIIPYLESYIHNLIYMKDAIKKNDPGFIKDFLQKACENKKEMLTK